MKRVAIYGRYSTDKQDATTLEGQRRVAEKYAEERGLVVVGFYKDEAVSGTHMRRPGLQELLADARAGRFDSVIVPDLSRLSRNSTDAGMLRRQLDDVGVNILDVETGTNSEDDSADMVFAMKGIISQDQVKTISKHTHRQLQSRAMAGHHTGGKAYGFSSVAEPTADPARPRRKLVILESEAEIVRQMFARFVDGQSPREIAGWLNAEKIAAPHDGGKGHKAGKGWGFTTVRSMLMSRRYIGEIVWNATRWKKNSEGHRKPHERPESDRVVQSHPELAIVDVETWARAQARFKGRKSPTPEGGRPPGAVQSTFVLSGLLRCGPCGATFGTAFTARRKDGRTHRRLGCMSHKNRGPAACSNGQIIAEAAVTGVVLRRLREILCQPGKMQFFFEEYARKLREMELEENRRTPADVAKEIAKQETLLGKIAEALITAPGSKILGARLQAEEGNLEALRDELKEMGESRFRIIPHPSTIERLVAEFEEMLAKEDTSSLGERLRRIIRPFKMFPEPGGIYRMEGHLDLSGLTATDKLSSGGTLRGLSIASLVSFGALRAGGDARR